jgi:hypothetical protein
MTGNGGRGPDHCQLPGKTDALIRRVHGWYLIDFARGHLTRVKPADRARGFANVRRRRGM